MKLNVQERLTLLEVLPKEGNFATLRIIRRTQDRLGLADEEYKEFGVKQKGNQISWNEKGREERDIQIGESATDIIVGALDKLDSENKLTVQHLTVFEKFKEVNKDGIQEEVQGPDGEGEDKKG